MEPNLFKYQLRHPACTCDGEGLILVSRVPRVGGLRELLTYRCAECGNVLTIEAPPNSSESA
jgi:hypothetical protein